MSQERLRGPTTDYFPKGWEDADSPGGRALRVECPRCRAAAMTPCDSVGPDSYARGAPLKRFHSERYAAAKAQAESR